MFFNQYFNIELKPVCLVLNIFIVYFYSTFYDMKMEQILYVPNVPSPMSYFFGTIFSAPPIYGLKTSGIVTLPSSL